MHTELQTRGESTLTLERWGPTECRQILEECKPGIGHYEWIWKIIKRRYEKTGNYPRRLRALLSRFVQPGKPYFVSQTAEGIHFLGDIRDIYSWNSATGYVFDKAPEDFLLSQAPFAGNYLDIGANMGLTAAPMALRLQGAAQVYAFEPVPETARRAAATFALNQLDNIALFPCAVGSIDGEITFYSVPGASDTASATPNADQAAGKAQTVPCRRLDSLAMAENMGPVGLMKIDVEGHEIGVIRGALALLKRDKPRFLYEYLPHIAKKAGWAMDDISRTVSEVTPYWFRTLQDDLSLTEDKPAEDTPGIFNIFGEPV